MESMKEKLTEYAQLLVRVGLNIQRGQPLVISSPVECAFFARLCAAEAYQAGCREVVMNWGDDELGRMKYLHAADEVFDTVPLWRRHFYNDYALEGAAYLAISASDPENLKGVDHSRIVRAQQASGRALKDFDRLQMCGGFPWCIASIPIPSWAKKVFPDLAESEAMDKLWEAIFQAVRITGDGRCVDKWHRHIETLAHRVEKLNQLNFKSLHYTNSLGTDLTVELPEDHIWEVHAEQGEEALKAAVTVDEGASYFGEVALVPYDSPISNQKILFYNTLFDENAACHIAFGEAYPCLKDGQAMSKDELKARGLNDSITHVDFMVGTPDLNILGITHDGKEIPVFVDGNFAPEI